jgi:FixJ family two-component response regulator
MLRQFGYASLLFPSAKAFAHQSDFDEAVCVLLDINLGDGSGIELRDRLKAAGNSVPVIYMTGNDTPAVREAALQSGCLAYLTKPFSAKSLPGLAHRVTSVRCGILLLSAHSGSRVSVRENTPRSVFRQIITYATSRSVVSSALAFGARRFSSKAMVAPMLSFASSGSVPAPDRSGPTGSELRPVLSRVRCRP